MQRLRGQAYLGDRAIEHCEVDALGRYRAQDDHRCWHFLIVDSTEAVIGCAGFLLHRSDTSFDGLRLRASALGKDPLWGNKLRLSVEERLDEVREQGLQFAELGGWALAREYRHTKAALEILLGPYVWADLIGHCLCSCTAAARNNSASILRRVGGASFRYRGQELPPYFDPQYGCNMELLHFDSRQVPYRFRALVDEMRRNISRVPVICATAIEKTESSSDLLHLRAALIRPSTCEPSELLPVMTVVS
jgi:hypothetical protein